MSLRRLGSARLDNQILANKDEVNNDKVESYIITDLITLAL